MRNFVYIPKAVEDKIMEGHVILNMPNYVERKKLLSNYGISAGKDGAIQYKDSALESIMKMASELDKYIAEINVNILPCKEFPKGCEIKSYEDMVYNPFCDRLIEELAAFLIGGGQLEKKL